MPSYTLKYWQVPFTWTPDGSAAQTCYLKYKATTSAIALQMAQAQCVQNEATATVTYGTPTEGW